MQRTSTSDYPPTNQWFGIGVNYYSDHGNTSDFHPQVVFCNGAISRGSRPRHRHERQHDPVRVQACPITFAGGSGSGSASGSNVFWLVADVLFLPSNQGSCAPATCIVQPLYADASMRPLLSTGGAVQSDFQPDYPPIPSGAGGSGAGGN